MTKEGVKLNTISERQDWVWAAKVRPNHNEVAVATNDGTITMNRLIFNTVHGLYQVSDFIRLRAKSTLLLVLCSSVTSFLVRE